MHEFRLDKQNNMRNSFKNFDMHFLHIIFDKFYEII